MVLYRTQGWKDTSSKSLGLTKLMVRSGMPVSFTEQSMYPWISVETVLPDLSMIASTFRERVRIYKNKIKFSHLLDDIKVGLIVGVLDPSSPPRYV